MDTKSPSPLMGEGESKHGRQVNLSNPLRGRHRIRRIPVKKSHSFAAGDKGRIQMSYGIITGNVWRYSDEHRAISKEQSA